MGQLWSVRGPCTWQPSPRCRCTDDSADAECFRFGTGVRVTRSTSALRTGPSSTRPLLPFLEAGRRLPDKGRGVSLASSPSVDNAAIRSWAKSSGLKVSERGRISADVIRQYEAAR